ncbi:MAG: hypothetical protein PHU51_01340 [Candidatus Nanoarchaeia archaeon]|nr:hypothetical protein [Candidatus Nanoarchaeia archaeon]
MFKISSTGAITSTGAATIGGNLNITSHKITNLANGTDSQDAVTYSQLQAVNSTLGGDLANYVPYTSATNNLDLNNKNLTSVSYVGIGTATPNANLQVNGTFNATNNGGSITLDSNGDVRIGI